MPQRIEDRDPAQLPYARMEGLVPVDDEEGGESVDDEGEQRGCPARHA
jgi:hypothetical protein